MRFDICHDVVVCFLFIVFFYPVIMGSVHYATSACLHNVIQKTSSQFSATDVIDSHEV